MIKHRKSNLESQKMFKSYRAAIANGENKKGKHKKGKVEVRWISSKAESQSDIIQLSLDEVRSTSCSKTKCKMQLFSDLGTLSLR